MGAFVDKSAGKLKRVDDAMIASMKLEPKLEMNYKNRRIILPKDAGVGEMCDPVKVQRADIDYNLARHCVELQLDRHLDDDKLERMTSQFTLTADYEGEEEHGSLFALYP